MEHSWKLFKVRVQEYFIIVIDVGIFIDVTRIWVKTRGDVYGND